MVDGLAISESDSQNFPKMKKRPSWGLFLCDKTVRFVVFSGVWRKRSSLMRL